MLEGRRVAVPESRELDLFTRMLERNGAIAIRCPLVSIHDVEDAAPVEEWLGRLVAGEHDLLVLYTGEGLSRLLGFAGRKGIEADVVAALSKTFIVARGPKPAKVLRGIGLVPNLMAEEPTTAGLVQTLSAIDLNGKRVGVQLYPGGEQALSEFLQRAGAIEDSILCYRYASDEEDERVLQFIDDARLRRGRSHRLHQHGAGAAAAGGRAALRQGSGARCRHAADPDRRHRPRHGGSCREGRLAGRRHAGGQLSPEAAGDGIGPEAVAILGRHPSRLTPSPASNSALSPSR